MKSTTHPKLHDTTNQTEQFVEFSFMLPILDLFYENWSADDLIKNETEINLICESLGVFLDSAFVEDQYYNKKSEDILVFHSSKRIENFILIDLLRDKYDQCSMVLFCVRVGAEKEEMVRDILLKLYKKNRPRSNFEIDYFNSRHYKVVFQSDFHFYDQGKSHKNRVIRHFGLGV